MLGFTQRLMFWVWNSQEVQCGRLLSYCSGRVHVVYEVSRSLRLGLRPKKQVTGGFMPSGSICFEIDNDKYNCLLNIILRPKTQPNNDKCKRMPSLESKEERLRERLSVKLQQRGFREILHRGQASYLPLIGMMGACFLANIRWISWLLPVDTQNTFIRFPASQKIQIDSNN